MEDTEIEELEAQYETRSGKIQMIIDTAASMNPGELEQKGAARKVADESETSYNSAYYVLSELDHLIQFRRQMSASPLDTEAVKAAYDDGFMKDLAGGEKIVSDGMGDTVTIEVQYDEAFRMIKSLPSDLGGEVFKQVMSNDVPKSGLDRLFE